MDFRSSLTQPQIWCWIASPGGFPEGKTDAGNSEVSLPCCTDDMKWHRGRAVFFSILLCPCVLCRREGLRLVPKWVCNASLTLVTLPFNQERAGPPNLEPCADNHASSDWMLFCFIVFTFMVTFCLWQAIATFHLQGWYQFFFLLCFKMSPFNYSVIKNAGGAERWQIPWRWFVNDLRMRNPDVP